MTNTKNDLLSALDRKIKSRSWERRLSICIKDIENHSLFKRCLAFILLNDRKYRHLREKTYDKGKRFYTMSRAANWKNKDSFRLKPFDLWQIAKRQKMKCAITGEKLNLKNISLDHITPVSKGGTNHPSNVQLVEQKINYIKSDLTLNELISLAKKILSNQK